MAERKSEHTGSTRTSAPEDVVPILKSDEVGVTNRVLGSGGFCTVSPVRWIKVVNPQESTTSTATSASASPINTPPTPPTPPSNTKANGQQHARTTLAKQFKDYEEKHHSSKNIVVPGYTTTPQPMDPFAQKPPRVALKRIKPSLRKERYHVGVNDLVAEASVLAKCSHPNIISLYAVGSCDDDDDADADAEQQARGGDNNNNASSPSPVPSRISFVIIDQLRSTLRNKLYKWKDDKGITPSFMKSKKALDDLWLERMVVIIKVADAIRYLHSKGIVHRDINPDNIGFADDNVVKLFDFGLAKSIGRDGKNCDATSDGGVDGDDNEIFDLTSLTGTIRYMSPEVALEMPYGFKVDVYSFSLVMHEILSLTKPFVMLKDSSAFTQEVFKGGRRPSLDETWPIAIQNVLQQMWSSDCAKRPSSKEVVDRLGALLRGDDDDLYPSIHGGWKKRFSQQIDSLMTY